MTDTIEPHTLMILPPAPSAITIAGQVANTVAAQSVFADYQQRVATNTLKRQANDLMLFRRYLADAGIPSGDLMADPAAWSGVSWGLVAGFQRWQLAAGYAVASVNGAVSTVKQYAGLATAAGVIPHSEHALMQRMVKGFSPKEHRRVDEHRPTTRLGDKKAHFLALSPAQIAALKAHPDTAQGRRDAVLMGLLLDHGLRCGEVALLQVAHLDLSRGTMTFFRPKVAKEQTHDLTRQTHQALQAYLDGGGPVEGPLLQTTRKGGAVTGQGMSERAITGRVADLGRRIGVARLSAHDLRHTWATIAARAGTPLDRLMEAGGWTSMAMPLRYIEAARIANEGVRLE